MEVEFSFDPTQLPIFPKNKTAANKHRPTFLGNSGVGIYHWTGNEKGKYLYEVQITDIAGMSGGKRNIPNENRFVRLDYGPQWTQRGVTAKIAPSILNIEKSHLDPRQSAAFKTAIDNGGADCICAVVAGIPVSYFEDVYMTGGTEEFPKKQIAVSSVLPLGPNNENPLPIAGIENPLDMYWGHRGDYVASDANGYKHFNKLNSGLWNTLKICFLPARYDVNKKKCKNAYIRTEVNKGESFGGGFDGEIKSGTRASRHTQTSNPEPAVYNDGNGDMKIRLLGHWGSTVKYRNIKIRSVGSVG